MMKNKKNTESNFDRRSKFGSKQSFKKTKHFITKPKHVNFKFNNRKLFSLQHQTLNLLRKADKTKNKQINKCEDELNKLMGHTYIKDDQSTLGNLNDFVHKENTNDKNKTSVNQNSMLDSGSSHSKNINDLSGAESQICSNIVIKPHNLEEIEFISKKGKKKRKKIIKSVEYGQNILYSDNFPELVNQSNRSATNIVNYRDGDDKSIGVSNMSPKRNFQKAKKRSETDLMHSQLDNGRDANLSAYTESFEERKSNKSLKKSKKLVKDSLNDTFSCENVEELDSSNTSFTTMVDSLNKSGNSSLEEIDKKTLADLKFGKEKLSKLNLDFYQYNKNNVLLTLSHPFSLFFVGILEIEVLIGTIDVIGCSLNQSTGKRTLYSSRGSSHLCISTKESDNFDDEAVEILSRHNIPESKISSLKDNFNDNVVVLILCGDKSELSSVIWPKFVEKYSEHILLPQVNLNQHYNAIEDVLQCTFHLNSDTTAKFYKEMPDWNSVFDQIKTGIHRAVICGGKGVGKSTLLRYLVNRSLPIFGKVLVLDLDPGQSEFMVPGCISAFLVNSPLLGPNFTHLQDPIRAVYFGSVDPVQTIKYYFDCLQSVMDYCNSQDELKNIPWFVNTMGFNKGFGVLITSSVIKKVSPTILVQIQSEFPARNFPSLLTSRFIVRNILDLSRHASDSNNIDYRVIAIDSAIRNIVGTRNERKKQSAVWGLSSPSLRNIAILSYFGQILNSKVRDIFQAEPYVVDISKIYLEVLNENLNKNDTLDAMNGNLVALCNKNVMTNEIGTCFGFGIVRAMDMETNQLFLLTPLKENILSQVNSLIKGSISLPNKLYVDPSENVTGHVPYVNISNNVLSSVVKKTFKNLKNDK